MSDLRILFLSDTHLGFDDPVRPRIRRRRRGPEFFANFELALQDAVDRNVHCIVHGGDLFFRSRVPAGLVQRVFTPLKKAAAAGIPVFIVPGNHERGTIPHSQFSFHPNLHVFTRPRTFRLRIDGRVLSVSGFPFVRDNIRGRFRQMVAQTGWHRKPAHGRLLCLHQSVAGASVGPAGFVFKWGPDVIRARDIPGRFSAVLAGHIHRNQVLTRDLHGSPMAAPVFYAGATDRVSFAERDEAKGYLLIRLDWASGGPSPVRQWEFHDLPTRPMVVVRLKTGQMDAPLLRAHLQQMLARLPRDAIVKLVPCSQLGRQQAEVLRADALRAMAGPRMNIEAAFAAGERRFIRKPSTMAPDRSR